MVRKKILNFKLAIVKTTLIMYKETMKSNEN